MVSKVSAILLAVREGRAHTLTEIAVRSGLPLSTVHRLANELTAWGLLDRDGAGGFRISTVLGGAGEENSSSLTAGQLRERIVPVMHDLFRLTGMQVRAGFLRSGQVMYVEKLRGHLPVTPLSRAARLPAHATALGKALLAFSARDTVDRVVAQGLRKYTARTITQPARLRSGLHRTRAAGFALCDRELDGHWSGVAVPVFGPGGRVAAALELRLHDITPDLLRVRAPLTIAATCVSRCLADLPTNAVADSGWWDVGPDPERQPGHDREDLAAEAGPAVGHLASGAG